MKARAAELRTEDKKGAKQADELQALLDRMAKMTPKDRTLAEQVHSAGDHLYPQPPQQPRPTVNTTPITQAKDRG